MSPNPEQFSIPENPKHAPTAGVNPNTAGHIGDIPYDTDPIDQHYPKDKNHTVDTGQIQQVLTSPDILQDGRTPARELPTVETEVKKSNKKLFAWIGGTAAALALAGSAIFVGNAGAEKTTPPAPVETSVSATPNQSQQPEVSATPTQTAEVKPGAVTDNFKFYTGEGEEFQTFEDIQKSVEFKIEDVPARADTINLVIERMEKAANYLPSEKTVRASLNKPTEQLTAEDFMTVYDQYLSAHDVMFSVKSGDLYDTLMAACKQTAYDHLISVAEGEEVPYAVKFTLHTNDTGLLISDNSEQNKVDDGALDQLGDYQLISADGGHDVVSENGNWYVAGNMELLKKAQ